MTAIDALSLIAVRHLGQERGIVALFVAEK
jgi:hypothetical protein